MNADQIRLIPNAVLFDRRGYKLAAYLRTRGLSLSLLDLDTERRRRDSAKDREEKNR